MNVNQREQLKRLVRQELKDLGLEITTDNVFLVLATVQKKLQELNK